MSNISSITPQNAIESNYIDFFTVYIHYKDSSYSVNDSVMLKNLVEGCPVRDGMAVRKARTLYSMIYNDYTLHSDICSDETRAKIAKPNTNLSEDVNNILKLYPNPTTGDIWMQIDNKLIGKNAYICIYNLVGGIVFNNSISISNVNRISPELESGTYFISIKSYDGSFENYNGKITVIK